MMGSWIVTIAMAAEAKLLTQAWQAAAPVGRRPAWRGRLAGREAWLVLTGMGLVNAASAATAALEAVTGAEALINLGCAGAYAGSGLGVGEAVLASEAVLADSGVLAEGGWRSLEKIGIPLCAPPGLGPLYHLFPADPALTDLLAAANPGIRRGRVATVHAVSGCPAAAAELEARWGGLVEEMEAAAVAQVAAHYGVAFAGIRGVSNMAGARELDLAAGAEAAQKALMGLGEA